MTHSTYSAAAHRVTVYGGLLITLVGGILLLLMIAGLTYGGPALQALRESARRVGEGEALAGLVGFVGGLGLAALPLVLIVMPLQLCDCRNARRCLPSDRSVSLTCSYVITMP